MKLKAAIEIWKHSDTYKEPTAIHWIVWLLENPESPISLAGAIGLDNHDVIHILLDRNMDIRDEAMVIGFTMGNTGNMNKWIKRLFKFCAKWIYPSGYRFDKDDMIEFNRGYEYGSTRPLKNIHLAKFDENEEIEDIRKKFGIELINTK